MKKKTLNDMLHFSKITDSNKEHLKDLIKWLFVEIQSSSGDGDGLWYSKYFSVDDIKQLLIKEKLMPDGWMINEPAYSRTDAFYVECGQESLLITNNESDVDRAPCWQQVIIIY